MRWLDFSSATLYNITQNGVIGVKCVITARQEENDNARKEYEIWRIYKKEKITR